MHRHKSAGYFNKRSSPMRIDDTRTPEASPTSYYYTPPASCPPPTLYPPLASCPPPASCPPNHRCADPKTTHTSQPSNVHPTHENDDSCPKLPEIPSLADMFLTFAKLLFFTILICVVGVIVFDVMKVATPIQESQNESNSTKHIEIGGSAVLEFMKELQTAELYLTGRITDFIQSGRPTLSAGNIAMMQLWLRSILHTLIGLIDTFINLGRIIMVVISVF